MFNSICVNSTLCYNFFPFRRRRKTWSKPVQIGHNI